MSRKINRRNTVDCAILNEIFIDDDSKKTDKRSMQLQRVSERDLKLSSGILYPISGSPTPMIASPNKIANTIQTDGILTVAASNYSKNVININKPVNFYDDRDTFPPLRTNTTNNLSAMPKLIETGNRFMSVASRPIGCRSSAPAHTFLQNEQTFKCYQPPGKMLTKNKSISEKSIPQTRQEFHETFANLIKLGSSDKQDVKPTSEDSVWQTELKDMIWLELQARHASRTIEQQDKYLYSARQSIPELLDKILHYR